MRPTRDAGSDERPADAAAIKIDRQLLDGVRLRARAWLLCSRRWLDEGACRGRVHDAVSHFTKRTARLRGLGMRQSSLVSELIEEHKVEHRETFCEKLADRRRKLRRRKLRRRSAGSTPIEEESGETPRACR